MPKASSETPSVVLVHGILGQEILYWNVMQRRLRKSGFRYHDCVLPYGMLGDMRIAAGILKEKVDACLRHDGTDKVDLLCHSAGGLVARYYLMHLGGAKYVRKIITLGTPHQGTYVSYAIGIPHLLPIARQARPGSFFLEEINGPGAIPRDVELFNFWAPFDGVVIPAHNSKLTGSIGVKVPFANHWSYLWSRRVYEWVEAALLGHVDAEGKPMPQK